MNLEGIIVSEIGQTDHLYVESKKKKLNFIETENKMAVARGLGWEVGARNRKR